MGGVARWLAARKSLVVSTTSASVVAILIATVAIVSGGYTAQRMDLGDGSVWVANGTARVIGRANTQVLALDTVVGSVGSELGVVQNGAKVLLVDYSDSKVDVVDAATSQVADSAPLPAGDPDVFLAGDNVVVVARATGQVWVTPWSELAHFDAQAEPTLSLGKNSVVSVSPDGVLFGYSAQAHKVYRLAAAETGSTPAAFEAGTPPSDHRMSITSVGDHFALMDLDSRELSLDGRLFDLSSLIGENRDPALQQPATAGDVVLVAYDPEQTTPELLLKEFWENHDPTQGNRQGNCSRSPVTADWCLSVSREAPHGRCSPARADIPLRRFSWTAVPTPRGPGAAPGGPAEDSRRSCCNWRPSRWPRCGSRSHTTATGCCSTTRAAAPPGPCRAAERSSTTGPS